MKPVFVNQVTWNSLQRSIKIDISVHYFGSSAACVNTTIIQK
uniref:Uncharacterized protein n=1 Tax=Rhizophora mucronata TaxID=61149 RepID=A0A2P2LB98_RHIMU